MATFSESDEPSTNMDNYAFVTYNKILYHKADVAVEERPESLKISPIESNVEAQTQINSKRLQKKR